MQEINLSNLPKDKVYVLLNRRTRTGLFDELFKKFERKQTLADLLKVKEGYSLTRYQKGLRYTPLFLLDKICKILNINTDSLQKNIELIKYGTNGKTGLSKPIKNPKFPIKLSYEFSYLMAKFIGDGTLTYNKTNSIQCCYANTNQILKDELIKECKYLFGDFEYKEYDKQIFLPSICGLIMFQFCNDFMSDTSTIPKNIMEGGNEFIEGFLRVIFEDEGCVPRKSKTIIIAMANKEIIYQIHLLLRKIDIYPNKIREIIKEGNRKLQHGFTITGRENLINFYNKIGFTKGYYKNDRLLKHIKSYKYYQNRINETPNKIVELFKEYDSLSTIDICNKLNMKRKNVLYHLNRLEKNNKIIREIKKPIQNYLGLLQGNHPHEWSLIGG